MRLRDKTFLAVIFVGVVLVYCWPSPFDNEQAKRVCQTIAPDIEDAPFQVTKEALSLSAIFGKTPYTQKVSGNSNIPMNDNTYWCSFKEVQSDELTLAVEAIVETQSAIDVSPLQYEMIEVSFIEYKDGVAIHTGEIRRTNSPLSPPEE